MKKLISVNSDKNFSVKLLGKNLFTYYNHFIMELSKDTAKFCCAEDNVVSKVMTDEVIDQCTDSEFDNKNMKNLKSECPDQFLGVALYIDEKLAGYLCGLKPEYKDRNYHIKNCEFYVKYVYVYEEFRGRRLTSELFRQLFLNYDITRVVFSVRKNNEIALKAYKRIGAKVIANKKFARVLRLTLPYYKI